MDKVYLRSLFLKEKGFLKQLYNNETQALINANDRALDVLIRILHLISVGEIPLKAQDKSVLKNKLNSLSHFNSKKVLHQMLFKDNRETKIKHLKQFLKFYPILLYSFFNEI